MRLIRCQVSNWVGFWKKEEEEAEVEEEEEVVEKVEVDLCQVSNCVEF